MAFFASFNTTELAFRAAARGCLRALYGCCRPRHRLPAADGRIFLAKMSSSRALPASNLKYAVSIIAAAVCHTERRHDDAAGFRGADARLIRQHPDCVASTLAAGQAPSPKLRGTPNLNPQPLTSNVIPLLPATARHDSAFMSRQPLQRGLFLGLSPAPEPAYLAAFADPSLWYTRTWPFIPPGPLAVVIAKKGPNLSDYHRYDLFRKRSLRSARPWRPHPLRRRDAIARAAGLRARVFLARRRPAGLSHLAKRVAPVARAGGVGRPPFIRRFSLPRSARRLRGPHKTPGCTAPHRQPTVAPSRWMKKDE